ncbi:NlpC/P60 family protein [Moraxella catarrhalis]|uniref:NlpC/P60 family protein n=1 Tax=Moraxella catarrhalis TaxID=480 RepID=A0A3Q9GHJ1_MORCA|nr:NlpC/P60 family protein [Moraxella catarrhalis]
MPKCAFDSSNAEQGIKALESYRKSGTIKWGVWRDKPLHDWASHGADAFRYFDGEIQAIVHSHPNGNAEPSEVDRVQMGIHGIDWVICAFGYHAGGEQYFDVKCHKPKAYQAPLLGREYHHGVQDCYSLVRDYYSRELDIHLPDFHRRDGWWEDENHEPLYEKNFAKAGFIKVQDKNDLQKHDVILCRVGRTHHVNHALIYVGDGKLKSETMPDCVGNALILHHPHGSLSVREIYGDNWQDARRWWLGMSG